MADRLENTLKNIVIRRLTDIRVLKAKPSLKDMVAAYMNKIGEKDERLRVRIKDQVLQIYEEKTFKQFEENDPNFNKIIVHIERVLKITTAQTLAIDSLERKITNLSKRNPTQQRDIVITTQDEKIKALIEDRKPEHVEAPEEDSDQDSDQTESENDAKQKKAIKFVDIFPEIKEDHFESSEEDEEKLKDARLERLG